MAYDFHSITNNNNYNNRNHSNVACEHYSGVAVFFIQYVGLIPSQYYCLVYSCIQMSPVGVML